MKNNVKFEIKFEALGNPEDSLESTLTIRTNNEEVKVESDGNYYLSAIIAPIAIEGIGIRALSNSRVRVTATKGSLSTDLMVYLNKDINYISQYPTQSEVKHLVKALKKFKVQLCNLLNDNTKTHIEYAV